MFCLEKLRLRPNFGQEIPPTLPFSVHKKFPIDPVARNASIVQTTNLIMQGFPLKVKLNSKARNVRERGDFHPVYNLAVSEEFTVRIYLTNCHK